MNFCTRYTPINTKLESNRIFTKVINPLAVKYHKRGTAGGNISKKAITIDQIKYNRPNFRDVGKDKNVSRQDFAREIPAQVTYKYNVEKAKRRLKAYNDQFNAGKSEITDRYSIGTIATHMHHIFPQSAYPRIADYVENLIALTSAQHLQRAHPNGDTRRIDPDYQYTCLICKTDNIRKDLIDRSTERVFYTFGDFMFVLDTGFSTDYFGFLTENDFDGVLSGIEINYKT